MERIIGSILTEEGRINLYWQDGDIMGNGEVIIQDIERDAAQETVQALYGAEIWQLELS